jgi:hypothetical protein
VREQAKGAADQGHGGHHAEGQNQLGAKFHA